MLHEEVELRWDELQCIIEDFQLLEKLRPSLIVGVSEYKCPDGISHYFVIIQTYYRAPLFLLDRVPVREKFCREKCTQLR